VTAYLQRARAAGLTWPVPPDLDDAALEARLFTGPARVVEDRALPSWPEVHQELKKAGVTLTLLWEEWAGHPCGYSYSQFCERGCRRLRRVCRSRLSILLRPRVGRPSLAPGRYFRLLLVGYFEGIDSERGIAWRAADSLAVRSFVRLRLEDAAPNHSTISRTRRLIDVETHRAVFTWVQQRLAAAGLVKGRTIAIDATTLEANAAMRSIVRRDTGEDYQAYPTRLAAASGIKTPTREALARFDRKRKKKTSNTDWRSPSDPDAKVAKMKDGRTHLAHKAEHAIDLDSGALIAVTLQDADQGDTTTLVETGIAAAEQVEAAHATADAPDLLEEVVADKGYHSNATMVDLAGVGIRSYISEPDRGRRDWSDAPDAQTHVYGNRRRMRGARGRRLRRRRAELAERSFAHLYETGGMRRTHLRGHENIMKRLLIHGGGFNLGLLRRRRIGIGKPRRLQGRFAAARTVLIAVWARIAALWAVGDRRSVDDAPLLDGRHRFELLPVAS
jgi:transposase